MGVCEPGGRALLRPAALFHEVTERLAVAVVADEDSPEEVGHAVDIDHDSVAPTKLLPTLRLTKPAASEDVVRDPRVRRRGSGRYRGRVVHEHCVVDAAEVDRANDIACGRGRGNLDAVDTDIPGEVIPRAAGRRATQGPKRSCTMDSAVDRTVPSPPATPTNENGSRAQRRRGLEPPTRSGLWPRSRGLETRRQVLDAGRTRARVRVGEDPP